MSEQPQHDTLEDFEITADEFNKIKEALKKQEFRDLFKSYVEEINDPENRKLYEKEITELERERGYEVKFIHPTFGFLIKTSSNGTTKTYINICSNPNIDPPVSEKTSQNGCGGLSWSIPYLLTPLKKNYGRNKNISHVYDAIFHPDSLHLASKSDQFQNVLVNTAIEGIESNFKIKIDTNNLKFLSTKYKGVSQPTVTRKKLNGVASERKEKNKDEAHHVQFGERNVFQSVATKKCNQVQTQNISANEPKSSNFTVPKYELKHRSHIDMQDFTNDSVSKINAATPKELVVTICLPLLKSASDADLDITGEKLLLVCETPAKYKLELDLPYSVYESKGHAVFDRSKRVLTVTLPVAQVEKNLVKAFEYLREDSGVESDRGSGSSSIEDDSAFHSDEKKFVLEETEACAPPSTNGNEQPNCDSLEASAFSDKNIHYVFPKFSSNYTNSVLAFTLHIKNSDPASVSYKFLKDNTAILFHLYSIGSGHFPVYFSFYVDITKPIEPSSVKVEVWDNSVIVQLLLDTESLRDITYYHVGLNEHDSNISKLALPHPASVAKNFSGKENDPDSGNNYRVAVTKHEPDEVLLELSTISESETLVENSSNENDNIDSDDDNDERENETVVNSKAKIPTSSPNEASIKTSQKSSRRKKRRCNSTSSDLGFETGDLASSVDSYNLANSDSSKQRRGILKYSRSLSESEPTEFNLYSSDYSCSLHECTDRCAHDDNNQKISDKRIRFSDSVSIKTFRSNVSIVSQNKRKQKKQKFKKRLQERRASESETECEVDSKSGVSNGDSKCHREIPDNLNHEISESNASVSETSGDTSDGSESNEYQAPSKLSQKSSKNRNRKNWQKTSGANAKLKVMNDLIFELDDV